MHCRFIRFGGYSWFLMFVVILASACSQMPKHSNALIFSTNTTMGLKVGRDVNSAPAINIGYERQEVALVPVYANTASETSNGGDLVPCPEANASDCVLNGIRGDFGDRDSYSTLASFGGSFGGGIAADSTEGRVALAQYFATGIAAQQLALSGGANIVQVGGDTKAKADAAADIAGEVRRSRAALEKIEKGELIAQGILSGMNEANRDEKLEHLASRIDLPHCSAESFKDINGEDAELVLKTLRNDYAPCLRELGAPAEEES